jgi:hypothetical protein
VPMTEEEIARRMPLWEALADLYLDTWMECFVPNVVAAAKEGGFALEDVEHILRWEVRPAFYLNLLSVAGEWAGWHPEIVREDIEKAMNEPPYFCRGPLRYMLRNKFMPAQWPEIQAAMATSAPTVSSIHPPPSTRSPS